MSTEHGSFNVSRKAFRPVEKGGDVLWNKPRVFSEWEAWEYLFARAAFKPHTRALRKGGTVELQRGETPPLAVRYLATKWRWSPNRVHKFMKMLATKLARVRHSQRTTDGDTYIIVNYRTYQPGGDGVGDSAGTQTGQRGDEREERLPPTTPTARGDEKPIDNAAQARVEMWAEFDRRAIGLSREERDKAQAVVRGIIEGDTHTAWMDQTGAPVPWAERPRLFRLALDERSANGGKLHVVLRQVVIPREYDPFPQTKSTDRKPREGTEAAGVRGEKPYEYRLAASTGGLQQLGTPKPTPSAPVDLQAERIKRWEAEHGDEAQRIRAVLAGKVASGAPDVPRGEQAAKAWIEAEYRKRVLEQINRGAAA